MEMILLRAAALLLLLDLAVATGACRIKLDFDAADVHWVTGHPLAGEQASELSP